eukprot:206070-Chlamydomonas_euryale.AAC.1
MRTKCAISDPPNPRAEAQWNRPPCVRPRRVWNHAECGTTQSMEPRRVWNHTAGAACRQLGRKQNCRLRHKIRAKTQGCGRRVWPKGVGKDDVTKRGGEDGCGQKGWGRRMWPKGVGKAGVARRDGVISGVPPPLPILHAPRAR